MTFEDLIKKMDEAYSMEGAMSALHEDKNYDTGDGLADFIYYETKDLVAGRPITAEVLSEVREGLFSAMSQLESVACEVASLDNGSPVSEP